MQEQRIDKVIEKINETASRRAEEVMSRLTSFYGLDFSRDKDFMRETLRSMGLYGASVTLDYTNDRNK